MPNQLIVGLQLGADINQLLATVVPQAVANQISSHLNIFLLKLPPGIEAVISNLLAASPLVRYVEPNRLRSTTIVPPNDTYLPSQWDLTTLHAVKAWDYLPAAYLTSASAGNGATRTKVALIDTGVDCTHPDFMNAGGTSTDSALGGQLNWAKSTAIQPTTVPNPACPWEDIYGHGTHTGGTIAAATNNATGVASVGFPLELIVYQVFQTVTVRGTPELEAADSDIATAIDMAVNAGAQVISMSIGGPGYSQSIQQALDYAWEHNVLAIAAAGNNGSTVVSYPGSGNHVLGVAATDSTNTLASFSNFGNWIKIAAPGVNILSTLPTYANTVSGSTNYGALDGTSMATPHVSAVAGLLYMLYPNLSVAEVAQRLQQTAQTPFNGWNQSLGYGIVDAAAALSGAATAATTGSLFGQVVQNGGAAIPISGALVTAGTQSFTTAADPTTGDDDGLFRIGNLTPGTYPITVTATGFSAVHLQAVVVAGADTMLTIAMGATLGEFTGTISYNGVAVAGAAVEAVSGGVIQGTALTNASGNYTVFVPPGSYTLTASAPNYVNVSTSSTSVGAGGTVIVNLLLSAYGTITGTVKDANGVGVPNAYVNLASSGFNGGTFTASNGTYSTFGIPAGSYTVTASASGYSNVTVTPVSVNNNTASVTNLQFSTGVALTSGLIGYWPFDEDAGSVAHDLSGSANNAAITNPTWVPGLFNSALSFNASNTQAVTPAISFASAFSVSSWVNPAVTTQVRYARIAETQYNAGVYLGCESTGTKYQFIVNSGNGATGTCQVQYGCAEGGTVTTGWHLVTGTYDGVTASLYLDGVLVGSDTATPPANASLPFYMGQSNAGGAGWNGILDDIRLYNRALTASEVTALFGQPTATPNLSLSKTADAATVAAGASIGYTLTAANSGAGSATAATLSDTLPSGVGVSWSISPTYSGPGTCSITGQLLSCSFGNLASNASASVHVTSGTSASSCQAYANTATLSASNSSSVPASATTTVQCPSLSLTKTADAATVAAGASIGYTLTAANSGTGAATAATLSDTLPSGTGISWSISPAYGGPGTCSIAGQVLSCSFGNLASNGSAAVHVTSGTSASSCQAYANTATLSASNSSSVPASATTTVLCPTLSLTKTADAATVAAGSSIGYTLTATNSGTGATTAATLSDTLPSGTGISWSISPAYGGPGTCSIAGQVLSCSFGNLASNGSAAVHVTSGTSASSCQAYANTATLSSSNSSSVPASATTTVQCPTLSLTKTADAPTVAAGSPIGFTLTATNSGTGSASATTLADTLPTAPGVSWSISPAYSGPGTCSIAGQVLSCSFGNLASNASATVHVTSGTSASSCQAYANTATLSASNSSSVPASATTTVQCPALSLTKTADAATVAAGSSIGYTLTAKNSGTGTATVATLADTLPAGTGVNWSISPAYSGPGTCSIAGLVLSCSFGNLASNATASVHVMSGTSASSCQPYANMATLSASNSISVPASATTTVQCPTLALTKTADAATVAAGSPIGFTLTATNSGTGSASAATLADTLPTAPGISWNISPAYSGPGTCSIAGQVLSCSFGNLASNASATVHVTSGTSASSCQAYANTATLSASNSSSVPASATTTVQCPALALTKTADAATVAAGSSIGYTLTAKNSGAGTATATTLSDTLPTAAGIAWSISPTYSGPGTCSITGQVLSCSFGNLASNASATVHVTSGTSASSCQAYANTATLSASNSSSVPASATTTVQCPTLSLTKTADAATVAAGSSIGYTLTAKNSGAGTATAITLSDTLPTAAGIAWSISPTYSGPGTCSITGQVLSCSFGNLASNASATVHVTSGTSASSCQAYANTATLSASNSISVPASATTTVQCPTLALTKTADAATVAAGSPIGFTLTATNSGTGSASAATLADTLPTAPGISWNISPAYSGPGTCSITGQVLSCSFGNLASNGSATVHVTSGTSASSCQAYANTATLSASNSSSVPASATTTVQCPTLALTKTADAATVAAGSPIGFTLTATNSGTGSATAAALSDTLPSGTGISWSISPTYSGPGTCSIAGQVLSCSFGNLASNATASVHVTSGTSASSCHAYANTATLSAGNSSSVPASATTTVQCPGLNLTKTADALTVAAGASIGYTLTANNTGTGAATSTTLTDTLPAGTGISWSISPAYSGPGTCSIAGQVLSCSFGNLASNATASVHVASGTSASSCAVYANTATLSASNSSSVPASATTTVQCPGLNLIEAADAPTVTAGASIGYTLSASNTGTGAATSATLTDTLPTGTGISWSISPAYSGPGTCTITNQVLTCSFGNLASNATASVHVNSATSSSSCASYANAATLSASNAGLARASATTAVLCPALSLTKTPDAAAVSAGSPIGYTMTVSNTGAGSAPSATLTDPLPIRTGIAWTISPAYNGPGTCAIANQTLACSFGNLASNATATVHVTSATSAASCATYQNTATASAANNSAIQSIATTAVQCSSLTITKSHQGSFTQGQPGVNYTLTVGNTGAAVSTGTAITVSEAPPAGLTLVSMAGTGWTCPAGGTTCARNDGLGTGLSYPPISVIANVSANAADSLINQATVISAGSIGATATDPTTIAVFTCDLTGDGTVNVADVQVIINEALGAYSAVNDLNHDGVVNVADVQKVINAALGFGCPY